MGVNKVEYGSSTLVDLTGDTVTPETLLQGETAHNAAGNRITGTARPGVQSFNGRSGSVLPIAGDYSADQVNYDSNKTVKQKIDALTTKEASDIAGQQSLVKDTVGWTGKNKWNPENMTGINNVGITLEENSDNSVTLNGTTTGEFIFPSHEGSVGLNFYDIEGGKTYKFTTKTVNSNIELQVYCKETSSSSWSRLVQDVTSGNELVFTTPSSFYDIWIRIIVRSGKTLNNVTIYPMITDASITDPTYEPYHESVEVMYEEEIHGVNLLKNIATSRTVNGVTFTVNADGSVTANGTATATAELAICGRNNSSNPNVYDDGKYIGNGCPSGGSTSTYMMFFDTNNADGTLKRMVTDVGNGGEFTITDNQSSTYPSNRVQVMIRIANGVTVSNLVFKPMLRKADIEDSTYRPYNHQAIQNQLNAQGVLGAKNLLQYPYNNNSKTDSGVTFTVNSDGTIVANGTAAADIYFNLVDTNIKSVLTPLKPNTKYIISGCEGGNNLTYRLWHPLRKSGGGYDGYSQMSEPIEYITPSDLSTYAVTVIIASGATVNNVKFKPMIRLASDPDDTYQPYAMTNKELTEKVFEKRTLTSADDLNNITETGIYGITTAPVNSPEAMTYCTLLVKANSSSDIKQIIFEARSAGGYIYIRSYGNNAWGSWYKFTGTVVS